MRSLKMIFAGFFISVLVYSCSDDKNEKAIEEPVRPVKYEKISSTGAEQERTFSGVSKVGTETKLSFRVSGVVTSIPVKVGEKVKRGTLISAIDDADFRLAAQDAKAAKKQLKAAKEAAKSNLQRVKELYENNNVSLAEYEKAKSDYESTKQAHKSAKKREDLKEREISYTRIYAPHNGIIANVNVEKNETVGSGQVIVVLNSGDDIEVTVGVPDQYIAGIKVGDKVNIKFSSIEERTFTGSVSEVSYAIDQRTSTYPVIIKLEEQSPELRPGMSADVTFHFSSKGEEDQAKILVPINAVVEDGGNKFVYILDALDNEDGFAIAKKTMVDIGELTGDKYEIEDGLDEGDLIITAGATKVSDSLKVKLLQN